MWMINVGGIALIALIVWWFWLYKPTLAKVSKKTLTVIVNNGAYQPSHIQMPANQPTTLQFLRQDASPCAETVVFPSLDISETLPFNQVKSIELPALKKGTYPFHCQMQMYRGKLHID